MEQHGECRTPGGSLAAVNLRIENRRLCDVRLPAEFPIRPEHRAAAVRAALAESLQGLPIDLEPAALAARLRAAIPFGVELAGTSPQAIAVAVRRAIENHAADAIPIARIGSLTDSEIGHFTAGWSGLPWRILPERTLSPALNVALDEVLVNGANAGQPPCLRFWRCDCPAVILGRCQSMANEIDLDSASEMSVQIVRRMSGGGVMFLQPHGAITYSLILPEAALAGLSLRASYEICDAWVIRTLRSLAIDAHHVPVNDIACGEGKIGGAAQARRGGVVLHHATLAYDMDAREMEKVLRIGRERLSSRGVASASKQVSPLVDQTDRSREAIVEELLSSFQSHFGGTLGELSEAELRAGDELVRQKYAHQEWTRQFE